MFCPQCGNKLEESMRFCTSCGRGLDDVPVKASLLSAQENASDVAFAPDAANAVFVAATGGEAELGQAAEDTPVLAEVGGETEAAPGVVVGSLAAEPKAEALAAVRPAAWAAPVAPMSPSLPERKPRSFAMPLLFGGVVVMMAALVFCAAYFRWYAVLPWFREEAEVTQKAEETPRETPQDTQEPSSSMTPMPEFMPAPVPTPELEDMALVSGFDRYGVSYGGYIYYTGYDQNGNPCIRRYSEGSGMSVIFAIFENNWVYPYSYAVYEDRLLVMTSYFDQHDTFQSLCFSVPLAGGELTYLFMLPGYGPLFMDEGDVYVCSQDGLNNTLYLYNGRDGLYEALSGLAANKILGNLSYGISFQEGKLYYSVNNSDNNGVYVYDLATEGREVLWMPSSDTSVRGCFRVNGELWLDVLVKGAPALMRYRQHSSDVFMSEMVISGGGYQGVAGMADGRLLLMMMDDAGYSYHWMNTEAPYETTELINLGMNGSGTVVCNSIIVRGDSLWRMDGGHAELSYTDLGLVDTLDARHDMQVMLAGLYGYENHVYSFPHFGEEYGRAQENGAYLYFLLGSKGVDGPGDIYRIKKESLESGEGALELFCDFGGNREQIMDFAVLNGEILFSSPLNAPAGECGYYVMDKISGEYRFLHRSAAPMEMRVWDDTVYMLDNEENLLYAYVEYGAISLLETRLNRSMNLSRYFYVYDGDLYVLKGDQSVIRMSLHAGNNTMYAETYQWPGLLPMGWGLVTDGYQCVDTTKENERVGLIDGTIQAIWGTWLIDGVPREDQSDLLMNRETARDMSGRYSDVTLWLDTYNASSHDAEQAIGGYLMFIGGLGRLEPVETAEHFGYQTILSAGSGEFVSDVTAWYHEGMVVVNIGRLYDEPHYKGVLYVIYGKEYVMEPDFLAFAANGVYQEAEEGRLGFSFAYDEEFMGDDFYLMVGLVRADGVDVFALNLYHFD